MAETYTPNIQLAYPSFGTDPWNGDVEANYALLDAQNGVGALAVGFHEIPSASLNVKVAAGVYRQAGGAFATYAGSASFGLTTAATNYVYLTDAGTLTKSTSSFPTGNHVRLAVVVCGASTITSITDARVPWPSIGGHVHWLVGTPTVAAGTGAGTSPTLTITGSDQAGLLTVLTGTSPTASAIVATVTFGNTWATAPQAVLLTPVISAAAVLTGNAQVFVDVASTTTAVWVVKVGSTNLTASTTFKWHYAAIG